MKKILLVLLVLVVAFAGCRKDNPNQEDGTAEVQFGFTQGLNLKDDPGVACFDVEGDYAKIVIDGTEYLLDVFYLNGIPYTQSIKLGEGTGYEVEEFMLMSDNNTPDNTTDDYAIMAAPHVGSAWEGFVENALNVTFDIINFDKKEIRIEVLCYEDDDYANFGFVYFQFYEIVVRQECFFGDICIKSLVDYEGSLYAGQPQGLQYDMPAIFYIEVWRNDVLQDTYSNESFLGVGEPLCVWYADRLQEVDEFEFKLYIYVDDGAGFSYKYFASFFKTDDEVWNHGADGIWDFVLGSCVVGADYEIGPYMDLPETCKLRIEAPWAPGDLGAYVDLTLSDIPAGYDLTNGDWRGWCMQEDVNIYVNTTYDMDVYSSIYTGKLPANAAVYDWDMVNWLMNNLDWYEDDVDYNWAVLQAAVWKIAEKDITFESDDPYFPVLSVDEYDLAEEMYTDATSYGDGFIPLPGYWAAVIFIAQNDPNNVQVVFTIVDP